MVIEVLIPAAGNATRMRGFPKFLLPSGFENYTLLELHLKAASEITQDISIAINPIFYELIMTASLRTFGAVVVPMKTETMNETVLKMIKNSNSDRFMVTMPDTVFVGENPYVKLSEVKSDLHLGLWQIRNDQLGKLGQVQINENKQVIDCVDKDLACNYPYIWGVQVFGKKYIKYLNANDPHIGLSLIHI